jgi:hypothetical protein
MIWLGKVFSPGHRQLLCTEVHKRRERVRGGDIVDARRHFPFSNDQRDHTVCVWLLWKWIVFACDQGCIHSANFIKNAFLKWMKTGWNVDKHPWSCPTKTLVCNCWNTDYTVDQLDASKIVQDSIECGNVRHLDYNIFSQPVHLHRKLSFVG